MHTRAMMTMATILLLTAGQTGCDDRIRFSDEGELCLLGTESVAGVTDPSWYDYSRADIDFVSGDTVLVRVVLDSCLSGSCTSELRAGCEVTREGSELIVESWGSYVDDRRAFTACTADCNQLIAECEISGLPDGTYTVRHGNATYPLTIPSSAVPACRD